MSEKMQVTLDREDLQAIFDIAVEGEGMMSGWWGQEEVDAARKIAVLLGLDPMIATPSKFAAHTPHTFEHVPTGIGGIYAKCRWCKVNSLLFPHVVKEEEK